MVRSMRIDRVADADAVVAGAGLFDEPPLAEATATFLASPTHHLLFAYDGEDRAVGMISGVETTHPDKGTEMFVYELGVDPAARRQGIATALVRALEALARERAARGDAVRLAHLGLQSRIRLNSSRPSRAVAIPIVWPGARRRSVGEPGLKMWKPSRSSCS